MATCGEFCSSLVPAPRINERQVLCRMEGWDDVRKGCGRSREEESGGEFVGRGRSRGEGVGKRLERHNEKQERKARDRGRLGHGQDTTVEVAGCPTPTGWPSWKRVASPLVHQTNQSAEISSPPRHAKLVFPIQEKLHLLARSGRELSSRALLTKDHRKVCSQVANPSGPGRDGGLPSILDMRLFAGTVDLEDIVLSQRYRLCETAAAARMCRPPSVLAMIHKATPRAGFAPPGAGG